MITFSKRNKMRVAKQMIYQVSFPGIQRDVLFPGQQAILGYTEDFATRAGAVRAAKQVPGAVVSTCHA